MESDITLVMTAYNSEATILKSLESVYNQTLRPNVIVVDDCSTDGTLGAIIDFSESHPDMDIKVIKNPENVGAGMAKRIGINNVETEFVTFLDSDDLLPRRALEGLYGLQREYNADLVCGGVIKVEDGKFKNPELPRYEVFYDGKSAYKYFMQFDLCNLFANSKLIKKSLLDKCDPYSDNRFEEDTDSVHQWFYYADRVVVDTLNLYYIYNLRSGSLCKSEYTYAKFKDSLKAFEHLVSFAEAHGFNVRELQGLYLDCMNIQSASKKVSVTQEDMERVDAIASKLGIMSTNSYNFDILHSV